MAKKKCYIIKINNSYYLTSKDEIKEGDWFIVGENIERCIKVESDYRIYTSDTEFYRSHEFLGDKIQKHLPICFKSIASTDTSLQLPLIPEDLIKAFIESNGTLKEVYVEYTSFMPDSMKYMQFCTEGNYIIWFKVEEDKAMEKENWNDIANGRDNKPPENTGQKLDSLSNGKSSGWSKKAEERLKIREAAIIYSELVIQNPSDDQRKLQQEAALLDFEAGTKWQKEQTPFSKEDMKNLILFDWERINNQIKCGNMDNLEATQVVGEFLKTLNK